MIYSVRDTVSVKLLVVLLRIDSCIAHWWLYCPLVVLLRIGGCIALWWLYCALVVVLRIGGCNAHWWLYCALVDVSHIGFRTNTGIWLGIELCDSLILY